MRNKKGTVVKSESIGAVCRWRETFTLTSFKFRLTHCIELTRVNITGEI